VTEIAVALVLLAGTGLIIRSLQNVANVDVGIDPGNVTTASIALPLSRYPDQKTQARFVDEYLARLNSMSGIDAAAMTFRLPVVGFATTTFTVEGQPVGNGEQPWADYRAVSTEYFRVTKTRLERGRVFVETDIENAPDVVIVNRALAERFWPGQDPIGKKLQIGPEQKRFRAVVGVAGDVHMSTLDLPVGPSIYVPHRQSSWVNALANSFVMVRSAQAGLDQTPAIRAAIRELDPELAVAEPRTMEDLVRGSLAQRRFIATLFTLFGILGYLLAAVGVYGVVSNMVSQRTYELAMRAVLGASPGTTFAQIIGRGVALGAAGCAIGLALTLYLMPYLSAQLFGIAPRDPSTLAGTVALLIAVSAAACARPAWKAMCVDPIRSLKGER
jgi:predicted permease